MVMAEAILQEPQKIKFLEFNQFALTDQEFIQTYIDTFKPFSCEYHFANLYAWQEAYKLSWTVYKERLLIYDAISQCAFMPLGKEFCSEELVILSLELKNMGLAPDFCLVTQDYLKKFPEIQTCFIIKEEPDYSEYIYDVDKLCALTGTKLHKKRNLISQFKRAYPDFEVHRLKHGYKHQALELAQDLMNRGKTRSHTLDKEFCAIKTSFDHFDQLGLEGLAITVKNKVIAFCVFSELEHSTYDIQFEKFDMDFKGAAQVINHETAKFLKDRCQYLNREQDLGIKGLRQAKLSYEPEKLIKTHRLIFAPQN